MALAAARRANSPGPGSDSPRQTAVTQCTQHITQNGSASAGSIQTDTFTRKEVTPEFSDLEAMAVEEFQRVE